MFSDSKVNIITEGNRYLGAGTGSNEFRIKHVAEKVTEWCEELKTLSNFVKSQSQAAYAAFCIGKQNKYSYFHGIIPSMSELMKPVDEIIQNDLLPFTGEAISENERQPYSVQQNQEVYKFPFFPKKPKMNLITPYT